MDVLQADEVEVLVVEALRNMCTNLDNEVIVDVLQADEVEVLVVEPLQMNGCAEIV